MSTTLEQLDTTVPFPQIPIYSLREIVNLVHGSVDGTTHTDLSLQGIADIRTSQPHHLSFLAHASYENLVYTTQAGALLVEKNFSPKKPVPCALIRVDQVYEALRIILQKIQETCYLPKIGVESPVHTGKACQFGATIYRGAFSYIGDGVTVGENVQIYPHVYIGDRVQIGKNCIIHAGAVLGSDGFGYVHTQEGTHQPIPQVGVLILEDDVHVGANTTIDRATFDQTHIDTGVRLDNLIQIGHNVKIGKHSALAAQSGVSGSTHLGPYCMVGGQVGFTGHLKIAARTRVAAQAGVHKSVPEAGNTIVGTPAVTPKEFTTLLQAPAKLGKLEKRIQALEATKSDSSRP